MGTSPKKRWDMSNDRLAKQINLLIDRIVHLYNQGKYADMVLVIDNLIHHAPDNKKRSELFDKIIIGTDLINNPNKKQKQTLIDILKKIAADLMMGENGKKLIQDKLVNLSIKQPHLVTSPSSTSQIDKMIGSVRTAKIKKLNEEVIIQTPTISPTSQSNADLDVPTPALPASRKR